MLNYLRYTLVALLLFSAFYSYKISLSEEYITSAIDKKLPMFIQKKGFDVNITSVTLDDVSDDGILSSTVIGTIKMNGNNAVHKKAKSFLGKMFGSDSKTLAAVDKKAHISISTTSKPVLNGSKLSFKIYSISVEHLFSKKKVLGVIQRRIEQITIPIKKLDKLSFVASARSLSFDIDGALIIEVGINFWLVIALIPLLLLREIGLLLISFYQNFLSPRKGYSCAKNHVHENGTCSSTTKQAFIDGGFISGMKEYKKSTTECKAAYKSLESDKRSRSNALDASFCAGCDGLYASEGIEAGFSGCEAEGCSGSIGDCGSGGCEIGSC